MNTRRRISAHDSECPAAEQTTCWTAPRSCALYPASRQCIGPASAAVPEFAARTASEALLVLSAAQQQEPFELIRRWLTDRKAPGPRSPQRSPQLLMAHLSSAEHLMRCDPRRKIPEVAQTPTLLELRPHRPGPHRLDAPLEATFRIQGAQNRGHEWVGPRRRAVAVGAAPHDRDQLERGASGGSWTPPGRGSASPAPARPQAPTRVQETSGPCW
mmetsp:Transcript_115338/g.264920  ORF Transcript_115338/g.264920 Transcript_115338/m.264920 type:complete len:215 (-) Transcript_115338:512-1156(-)